MAAKNIELSQRERDQLIDMLQRALADEWLAYYQYWIGARVVTGPLKETVIAELNEHAADELRHAEMVVERIHELGGKPLLTPEDWFNRTNCGYEAPTDPSTAAVLDQNIQVERCAIKVYLELLAFAENRDLDTFDVIQEIHDDEVEHEEDLMDIRDKIERRAHRAEKLTV